MSRFFRKILTFTILILVFLNATSQQLPMFSQYTFNAFLLNPAAAGADGFSTFNLTSRSQWVGVEGAPLTGNLSFQSRILMKQNKHRKGSARKRYLLTNKIGLAGSFYFDRAGLIDQTCANFTYAYHITSDESQLSLGVTFSILQYKINTSSLSNSEVQTSQLLSNNLVVYLPDANLGAYYTRKNMYAGISIMQISQGSINFQNYESDNFIIYRHYYFIGGYKYELSKESVLEPSICLKTSQEWRFQSDMSLKYIYNDKYWFGLTYRTSTAFIANIGMHLDRFNVGYAFDYSTRGVLNHSKGSHELMLSYRFGDNASHSRWLQNY